MDSNDVEIVRKSLTGERVVDGPTFDSLATLTERLNRLRRLGGKFSHIDLSPAAKHLVAGQKALAVS